MKDNLKTIAYAAPTAFVTKLGKDLRAVGYDVVRTPETLVAKVTHKNGDVEVIARALKMRSTWSVRVDPRAVTVAE